jgi:hypothetical protein
VLSNKQKIYNTVSAHLRTREFSRRDLLDLIDTYYPGTNHGSILPSDYLCKDALKGDPSNQDNRGNYRTFPRFLDRLGKDTYKFLGWDGIEKGSIEAPNLRAAKGEPKGSTAPISQPRAGRAARVSRKEDAITDRHKLVDALRRLAPAVRRSSDRAWNREPALRVLDCVLSLHRPYDSFVVPRLDRFEQDHPEIRTVSDLQGLIATYPSPHRFVVETLDYRDEARAATLSAVVDWLVTISGHGSRNTQLSNLHKWATGAYPADHAALRIRGFGLGGFQYLRMLFGANTTKPDVHIRRYVASCVGHSVSDIEALKLLEGSAPEADVLLRDLDTTVWEDSSRRSRKERG